MVSFIVGTILIYFLIRFVFNFLIPLFRVASRMKSQVRDFNERMGGGGQFRPGAGNPGGGDPEYYSGQGGAMPKRPAAKPKAGDYIDFEEIR